MSEFVITLREIEESPKHFSFTLRSRWMEQALEECSLRSAPAAGEARLEVDVQRNGREILLKGQLRARLVAVCARCLGDAPFDVDGSLLALLSPEAEARQSQREAELELDEEDLSRGYYSGNELVLDELVREHLIIECPMQPLCDPDCAGAAIPDHVRPPSGIFEDSDGGVDPRLAPLQQFKDKLDPNKE